MSTFKLLFSSTDVKNSIYGFSVKVILGLDALMEQTLPSAQKTIILSYLF